MHFSTQAASLFLLLAPILVNGDKTWVHVGNHADNFDPDLVRSQKGDYLIFHIHPGYDVVQGLPDQPCKPKPGGFYSGLGKAGSEAFIVNITSTDPIYVYCSQKDHCQKGMVATVNPPTKGDQTLARYREKAKAAPPSSSQAKIQGGQWKSFDDIAKMPESDTESSSGEEESDNEGTPENHDHHDAPSVAEASSLFKRITIATNGSTTTETKSTGVAGSIGAGNVAGALWMAVGVVGGFL